MCRSDVIPPSQWQEQSRPRSRLPEVVRKEAWGCWGWGEYSSTLRTRRYLHLSAFLSTIDKGRMVICNYTWSSATAEWVVGYSFWNLPELLNSKDLVQACVWSSSVQCSQRKSELLIPTHFPGQWHIIKYQILSTTQRGHFQVSDRSLNDSVTTGFLVCWIFPYCASVQSIWRLTLRAVPHCCPLLLLGKILFLFGNLVSTSDGTTSAYVHVVQSLYIRSKREVFFTIFFIFLQKVQL